MHGEIRIVEHLYSAGNHTPSANNNDAGTGPSVRISRRRQLEVATTSLNIGLGSRCGPCRRKDLVVQSIIHLLFTVLRRFFPPFPHQGLVNHRWSREVG
ncbi:hypothetical protein GGTG_08928 [Gaeumannomyces tritici R3-111a-1]|uniref:Uncharacterized protein n=1 Tax=Gaeumannomyces tritici (strain R3-111a-1) TaxID=644352 RepID=J3P5Y8_GAET3|nr:hypothetical protein GGTG_08928 [Gaeumannomyces tritici R3-111a-1]EJT75090.1 hypothetical protein GGTG_08928 [Gaeumannomyces tritici R3-111a-1]